MKQILFVLLLTAMGKCSLAQGIEVISKSDATRKPVPKNKGSVFIHPKTDTSQLQFVATYKLTGGDSLAVPGDLFLLIKKQARNDGANSFRLKNFYYDNLRRAVITIDAYYGSDAAVTANLANYETNIIYIFCPEKTGSDSFSLKINNATRTFNTGTYLKFVLQKGEELKMSKGGFTGAKAKFKYAPNQLPQYLMVFGGTTFGGGPLPPPGSIGVSFSTGQIREMTDDYGQFLAQILKPAQ